MYPMLSDIVRYEWHNIPNRYHHVSVDEFVIMPNHIHGIIVISLPPLVGATLAVARNKNALENVTDVMKKTRTGASIDTRAGASPAPTVAPLGNIVGSFKSLCTKSWLDCIKTREMDIYGKIWQRNYYDHIVRNKRELQTVREYIRTNPDNWLNDEYYQNENH